MHLVSCYIITAYVYGRDISWSVFFSTREMNIALLDVDGFQTWFGSVQFSSFCFWEHRVSLYSLCFKGEFQRYFEGFYMCFTYLSRTKKYLCARSQLSTRNKTLQLIRFTRRTETTTDVKSALAKQPLRCEANYQRRIYGCGCLSFSDVYRFLGNRVRFFSIGPEYKLEPDFVYNRAR